MVVAVAIAVAEAVVDSADGLTALQPMVNISTWPGTTWRVALM